MIIDLIKRTVMDDWKEVESGGGGVFRLKVRCRLVNNYSVIVCSRLLN